MHICYQVISRSGYAGAKCGQLPIRSPSLKPIDNIYNSNRYGIMALFGYDSVKTWKASIEGGLYVPNIEPT